MEEVGIAKQQQTLLPDQNPYYVYLARLAPGSRPAMRGALGCLARLASSGRLGPEEFPWHSLRYQHTQALRSKLAQSVSTRTGKLLGPATVNRHLAALRGVLKEAWRLGLMSAEDLARAADLEPLNGNSVLRGRCLTSEEVTRLFEVCAKDTTAAGARDAAILASGLGAGLRRAEMVGLDVRDVDLEGGLLRVLGKGHKVREVPVAGSTVAALEAWLEWRGTAAGPFLCPVMKAGTMLLRRLTPQAIQRACEKRAGEAGVLGFTPHDLRRTYVSALLGAGVDLVLTSDLVGHSSVQTTKRYDLRGAGARRTAAKLADPTCYGR